MMALDGIDFEIPEYQQLQLRALFRLIGQESTRH